MWAAYRSASSSTKISSSLTFAVFFPLPNKNSSIRPGVPTIMSEPWERNLLMSSEGGAVGDTRRRAGGYSGGGRSSESNEGEVGWVGCANRNWVTTECIWAANSLGYGKACVRSVPLTRVAGADLVGLIISEPSWFGSSLPLLHINFFRTGTTKASVSPEPVKTSTTMSLCCMNNGIVAAWTGCHLRVAHCVYNVEAIKEGLRHCQDGRFRNARTPMVLEGWRGRIKSLRGRWPSSRRRG